MKFLLIFLLTSALMAEANTEKSFFKCVRKVVMNRQVNEEVLTTVVDLARRVKTEDISTLTSACEDLAASASALPKLNKAEAKKIVSKLYNDAAINATGEQFLNLFYNPETVCNIVGVSANASLLVGVGAALQVGSCTSDNGRKSALVAPGLSGALGLGAFGVLYKGKYKIYRDQKNKLLSDDLDLHIGFIYAERVEDITDMPAKGVGVGLVGTKTVKLNLRLVPIGFDFEQMKTLAESL